MAMNISDEIDLDRAWSVSVGVSKSGVYGVIGFKKKILRICIQILVTIMIVFTVVKYLLDIVIVENFTSNKY